MDESTFRDALGWWLAQPPGVHFLILVAPIALAVALLVGLLPALGVLLPHSYHRWLVAWQVMFPEWSPRWMRRLDLSRRLLPPDDEPPAWVDRANDAIRERAIESDSRPRR